MRNFVLPLIFTLITFMTVAQERTERRGTPPPEHSPEAKAKEAKEAKDAKADESQTPRRPS